MTWNYGGTDIGNAYLESYTKEKVVFRAGPEFGDQEGHLLVIIKVYMASDPVEHDGMIDCLTHNPKWDSSLQRQTETYECMRRLGTMNNVAVYMDDLLIASKDPQAIIDWFEKKNLFKLTRTGRISFHLGCNFFHDDTGTSYIKQMVAQYESMFGCRPKTPYTSPLTINDHPELDTYDLLENDGIAKYQSLLGTLQWMISLGRFDICTAVMTMSGFHVAPREGHLDCLRQIYGYLCKMKHGYLCVRTGGLLGHRHHHIQLDKNGVW